MFRIFNLYRINFLILKIKTRGAKMSSVKGDVVNILPTP